MASLDRFWRVPFNGMKDRSTKDKGKGNNAGTPYSRANTPDSRRALPVRVRLNPCHHEACRSNWAPTSMTHSRHNGLLPG